jgi:hypothetical protein
MPADYTDTCRTCRNWVPNRKYKRSAAQEGLCPLHDMQTGQEWTCAKWVRNITRNKEGR